MFLSQSEYILSLSRTRHKPAAKNIFIAFALHGVCTLKASSFYLQSMRIETKECYRMAFLRRLNMHFITDD